MEHQRRVDVALAAPTVGSLSVLTADLQLSADAFRDLSAKGLVAYVPSTTPAAVAVTPPQPATKLVWAKGRLAALAVVLSLMGGCLRISTATSQQDNGSGSGGSAFGERFEQSATAIDEAYLCDFVEAYKASSTPPWSCRSRRPTKGCASPCL